MKDFSYKIRSLEELAHILIRRKKRNIIVFCHGVFDIFHPGHLHHLQQACAFGNILVVGITADRFVNKGPGRPIFGEKDRMNIVAALCFVDHVVLMEAESSVEIINAIKPDVFLKGKDTLLHPSKNLELEIEAMKSIGGIVEFTDSLPIHASDLVKKI